MHLHNSHPLRLSSISPLIPRIPLPHRLHIPLRRRYMPVNPRLLHDLPPNSINPHHRTLVHTFRPAVQIRKRIRRVHHNTAHVGLPLIQSARQIGVSSVLGELRRAEPGFDVGFTSYDGGERGCAVAADFNAVVGYVGVAVVAALFVDDADDVPYLCIVSYRVESQRLTMIH
jgi:hypothetical protein